MATYTTNYNLKKYNPADRVDATAQNGNMDAIDAAIMGMHPVGCIYESTVSTSPATLFGGGTWVQLKDRFLIGAGGSYAAGATGGATTVTLTTAQIPSHEHSIYNVASLYIYQGTGSEGYGVTPGYSGQKGANAFWARATGGGGAHNNMPPYRAVYQWYRSA